LSCVDATAPTGLSSYSFFAADAAGNVALVGTVGPAGADETPGEPTVDAILADGPYLAPPKPPQSL